MTGQAPAFITTFRTVEMSPVPLYTQVKENLRERILDGSYPAHARLPAENELSTIFGVSRITVRQALNDLQDEPFAALDAQTRLMMQQLLLDLWARIRTTIVFITHDIDEALFLADRLLVMSPRPGRIIEQIVVPFARPRDASLVTSPAFTELKRRCLQLLHPATAGLPLARLTPLGAPTLRDLQFAI